MTSVYKPRNKPNFRYDDLMKKILKSFQLEKVEEEEKCESNKIATIKLTVEKRKEILISKSPSSQ